MHIKRFTHRRFHFGCFIRNDSADLDLSQSTSCVISEQELLELVPKLTTLKPVRSLNGLLGREKPEVVTLAKYGQVVIKRYLRGGLRRLFFSRTYFGFGASRAEQEALLLERVSKLGLLVPQVVCFVKKGSFIYQTWLVTKLISDVTSLAELAITDEERTRESLEQVGDQILVLVKHGIYHVDLHPGNVLVDDQNKVYLIDFDKAYISKSNRRCLADRYLLRWRRAVLKHSLPEYMIELMSYKLRSCLDGT